MRAVIGRARGLRGRGRDSSDQGPQAGTDRQAGEDAVRVPGGLALHVSGVVPRVVVVLAATVGVLAQTIGRDLAPGALLPVLFALLAVWRPVLPTVGLAVIGLMVLAALAGGGPDARLAVTILAVHVLHVAGGLAAVLPTAARVELAVFRPTWQRFLLVQVLSQATFVVAVAVSLTR